MIYLIGSLRNQEVPNVAQRIRETCNVEVFDDWYAAGPEADDYWRDYERQRGRSLPEALGGHAAKHVFEFDKSHLDRCDMAILLCPAGKSGHLELGYCAGIGKRTVVCLDGDPDRYDVMYGFVDTVVPNVEDLLDYLVGCYFYND